jgi:large subunit ribosomal protein L6e
LSTTTALASPSFLPPPNRPFPPFRFAGPFAVNGVPLRRVNQAYVIATSTKVNVAGVDVSQATDKLLAAKEERTAKAKALKGNKDAFYELQKEPKKKAASAERQALQTKVDGALKLSDEVKAYLKARFALSKNDRPHAMKF